MTDVSKWDKRYLSLARNVAAWSKDPSTKVGAVIADANHRVISTGYNGPPRRVSDDGLEDRPRKLRRTIHAEKNAILFAWRDLTGCTLYSTHHPCAQCAAMVIQAGITRVVIPESDTAFVERWAEEFEEAQAMFKEAEVSVLRYGT